VEYTLFKKPLAIDFDQLVIVLTTGPNFFTF
jgi:hypothetical protein